MKRDRLFQLVHAMVGVTVVMSFAVCSMGAMEEQPAADVPALKEQAGALQRSRQYEEAAGIWQQIVEQEPTLPHQRELVGLWSRARQPQRVVEAWERYLAANPEQRAQVLQDLMRAYRGADNYDAALAAGEEFAVARNRPYRHSYTLYEIALQAGRQDLALQYIEDALAGAERSRDRDVWMLKLAELLLETGRDAAAELVLQELVRTVEHDRTERQARVRLGAIRAQRELASFMTELEQRVADNPAEPSALDELARAYRAQGRFEDAEPLYARLAALGRAAAAYLDLAYVREASGDQAGAIDAYQAALGLLEAPAYIDDTIWQIARLMLERKQDRQAEVFLRRNRDRIQTPRIAAWIDAQLAPSDVIDE